MPVETLTAAQVSAAKAASAGAEEAAEQAKQRGNAAFGTGRFDEAVAAYSEAISLWPDGAGLAWGNRSAAQLKLQKVEAAISDAEEMVRLLPELPKSHFRLGSALAVAGRHSEAAGSFAAMLWLDPSSEVSVQAVSLATKTTALAFGGVYQCHLLLPAKVVEWMMVDGLPKLGS